MSGEPDAPTVESAGPAVRASRRRSARDWAVDVTCLLFAALVALLVLMDLAETGRASEGYLLLSAALAVPGSALIWWRRRWPVGVALALLAPAAITEAVGGSVLIAVFTVGVHRRGRVALAVAAAHPLVTLPYPVIRPDPDLNLFEYHALTVVLLTLLLAWATRVRSRRAILASLRERAVRAEREATRRAERLRGLERERIAREMHDVLAHRISLVSLHAGALEIRPDLPAETVTRTAALIRASAHQALEELREILDVLRAGGDQPGLGPQPDLADLDGLIAEARAAGTPVQLDRTLPPAAPPTTVSRTAYRVVQEGLTNARKHAPGASVRVTLARTSTGDLHVWLHNPLAVPGSGSRPAAAGTAGLATVRPGTPANPPARPGPAIPGARCGLVGLVERVNLAGGRADHGARRAPDGGVAFHLEAWLPWPA